MLDGIHCPAANEDKNGSRAILHAVTAHTEMLALKEKYATALAQGRFAEVLEAVSAEPPGPATALLKSQLLTMMGRVLEALEALEGLESTDDSHLAIERDLARANAMSRDRTGDLNEARTLLAAIVAGTSDARQQGLAHLHLSSLARRSDRHQETLEHLEAARHRLEYEPEARVQVLDATGAYWAAMGDAMRARAYFEHAIEEKTVLGDSYGLAISHGQLGRLLFWLHELTAAKNHFQADLDLCQTMGDARGEALCLVHLGRLAALEGDYMEAFSHLEAAFSLRTLGGVGLALALRDRASVHRLASDLDSAASDLELARSILDDSPNPYGHALLLHEEGLLTAAKAGGADPAVGEQLHASLEALVGLGARLEQLEVSWDLANHYRDAGHSEDSYRFLQRALALAEDCRADLWVKRLEPRLSELDPVRWLEHVLAKVRGLSETGSAGYALNSESRFVVLLFSDIVGFTSWSSALDAEVVVHTLNDYFERMSRSVRATSGFIDKYIGDGLMVIFEGEESPETLATNACRCALQMLEDLEIWNQDRERTGKTPLRIRIGLNAGRAVVGNIGSYAKVSRTSVGRTVNLAARLESLSQPNRVLCGAEVHDLATDFSFSPPIDVNPKGLETTQAWFLEA